MSILKNVMIGLDQTVNCLFCLDGEYGSPDETLSARAWRKRNSYPKLYVCIDRLFFWDKQGAKRHCQLSYDGELARAHLPSAYRAPQNGMDFNK